jgi:hypothetical protein
MLFVVPRCVSAAKHGSPFTLGRRVTLSRHINNCAALDTTLGFKQVKRQFASSSGKMMDVDRILAGKYPAKSHARRVVEYIKRSRPDAEGVLYLEGQKTRMIEDNDEPQPFR